MLDFSRTKFDKTIKTALDKKIVVRSKYTLVTLADLCEMYQPKTISGNEIKTEGEYKVYGANGVIGYYDKFNHEESEVAMTCRGATCGTINYTEPRSWITGNAMVITPKDNRLLKLYLKEYLTNTNVSHIITGSAQPQITRTNLSPLQIPLPPLEVQEQIIAECVAVDNEYNAAQETIQTVKQNIQGVFDSLQTAGFGKSRLSQLCNYSTERTSVIEAATYITTDNMLQNCEGISEYTGTTNIPSAVAYKKGDVLVSNIRPYLQKIWYADRDGACSPDVLVFRVNNDDILSKFLYYSMKRKTFFDYIMNQAGVNGIKMPRGNKDATMNFEVVVPSIADQQQIIAQVEQYEAAIRQAQAIMEGCAARKKTILDKYLN